MESKAVYVFFRGSNEMDIGCWFAGANRRER